jgi:hypothetical protein
VLKNTKCVFEGGGVMVCFEGGGRSKRLHELKQVDMF